MAINFFGFSLYKNQVETLLLKCKTQNSFSYGVTQNAEMLVKSQQDIALYSYIKNAAFVTADGMGLVWAIRFLTKKKVARITGIDLLEALLSQDHSVPLTYYCIGGAPEVAKKATQVLEKQFTKARLVGSHHGYFNPDEEMGIIETIQSLSPDVILVGMGTPRQEAFILHCQKKLRHGLAIGVGGVFDVYSGRLKRAPKWVQNMGLEWLYRVIQDPGRVRRLGFIPQFFFLIIKEKIFLK